MTVNSLGQQQSDASSRTVAERLLPLLPIGLAMFTLSALLYYHLRHDVLEPQSALQVFVAWIYRSFGFAPSFLGFLLLLTWGSIWFVTGSCERAVTRLARLFALVVMLGVVLNLGEGGVVSAAPHKGELGAWLAGRLYAVFGYYPSLIAVWTITVAALLLATDFFFRDAFERMRQTGRADQAGRPDAGVEAEVTDHLKGLAAAAAAPRRTIEESSSARNVEADDVVVPDVIAAHDDEVEVQPEVDEYVVPAAPSRRMSYFERRRGGEPLEEEEGGWVPMAPESQDIDNPESDEAEAVVAAADEPVGATDDDLDTADDDHGADELAAAVEDEHDDEDDVVVVEDVVEDEVAADDDDDDDETDAGRQAPRANAADWFEEPVEAASTLPAGEGEEHEVEAPAVEELAAPAAMELDDDAADELTAAAVHEDAGEDEVDEDEAPVARAELEDLDDAEVADEPGRGDEAELEAEPVAEADEPVVSIPRPSTPPEPARQRRLFHEELDPAVVEEAQQLVLESRRASAAMLQRKLRIDFDTARRVLAELAGRGLVELDADAAQGRLLQ